MYEMKTKLANKANYGNARALNSIKYIVIHYTGNDGDTDENNGKYFANHIVKASAHYFVDSNSVTQSVPDNYIAYSVGGKKYGGTSPKYYGKCTNSNSISIELCDDVKNGVVYPCEKTIENALDLVRELMKKYGVPSDHVIRHYDVVGKKCPAYWVSDSKWEKEFHSKISESKEKQVQNSGKTVAKTLSKKECIMLGQEYSNTFLGKGHVIKCDGVVGAMTRKQAYKCLQHALNKDYKANLAIDGVCGSQTDKIGGKHYVEYTEKQYLVSCLEIIAYLQGKDPNGFEMPGHFGNGLKKVLNDSKVYYSGMKAMIAKL